MNKCLSSTSLASRAADKQDISGVAMFLNQGAYGHSQHLVDLAAVKCPWLNLGAPCGHTLKVSDLFKIPESSWRRRIDGLPDI
jgi:hypothetical protein